jgi:hypothetical protein
VANGIDPGDARKQKAFLESEAMAQACEPVAATDLAKITNEGRAAATLAKCGWMHGMVTPDIGRKPTAEITALIITSCTTSGDSIGTTRLIISPCPGNEGPYVTPLEKCRLKTVASADETIMDGALENSNLQQSDQPRNLVTALLSWELPTLDSEALLVAWSVRQKSTFWGGYRRLSSVRNRLGRSGASPCTSY